MINVLTFAEAIEVSSESSKRHLLLGNGFSIGCRPEIFTYASLYKEADFTGREVLQRAFEALNTQDFEQVIRSLEAGARLAPLYLTGESDIAAQMLSDAKALKDILLSTIAMSHPERPSDIREEEFHACRSFLHNFIGVGNKGYVFSLNYDLLLYWALMHEEEDILSEAIDLKKNDGFGNLENDPGAEFVVWHGETGAHQPNVFFLHGALHLYDAGSELQKFTWARTDRRLVEQARAAVAADKFPLFVAEGTSEQKKSKIRHNAYLYQGFKVLTKNADSVKHAFFVFGHSLASNDDHILQRLGKGQFKKLFISLYGDPDTEVNCQIIKSAKLIKNMRSERFPLEVYFYDAESAEVWG